MTGDLSFTTEGSGGAGVFGDHALEWRGTAIRAELSTNEARLTGTFLLNWNCDVFLPDYVRETSGAIATGSVVLRNSVGTWEGVWRGLTYPDLAGGHHHVLLTGNGPYAGYSALLYLSVDHGTLVAEGLVFPGDMPPVPTLPAEPTPHAASRCLQPSWVYRLRVGTPLDPEISRQGPFAGPHADAGCTSRTFVTVSRTRNADTDWISPSCVVTSARGNQTSSPLRCRQLLKPFFNEAAGGDARPWNVNQSSRPREGPARLAEGGGNG